MKTAVIKTGGKQYLVQEGTTLRVEKITGQVGKEVNFTEVLLTATDKTVKLGDPIIKGAKVSAKVLEHGKGDKISGVKMKAKKRNRKYFSHRQQFTKIEISKISSK